MGSSHRQLKCDPFGVLRRAALTYESTIMKHSLILARSGSRSRRKGPILTINSARQWKIAPWSPMKKGRMKGHSRVFLPAESAKVRRSTNTNQLRAKRHLIPKTPSGVTGYGATICTVSTLAKVTTPREEDFENRYLTSGYCFKYFRNSSTCTCFASAFGLLHFFFLILGIKDVERT